MVTFSLRDVVASGLKRWHLTAWTLGNKMFARHRRKNLKNKNFSIISNNCIAGGIYQKLGLPYATPTIGLFFFSDDYIRFLENFEFLIKQPLMFKEKSRHPEANDYRLKSKHCYPIAEIGDNVEIHFLHYSDNKEAEAKWARRLGRVNFQNLFFIHGDIESFKEEHFRRYEKLGFKNKIFVSSKPRERSSLTVFVRDYKDDPLSIAQANFEKRFDLIKWLNGEA